MTLKIFYEKTAKAILSICFPPACIVCRVPLPYNTDYLFCDTCNAMVERVSHPICRQCGIPFRYAAGDDHYCGECLQKNHYFDKARAVVLHKEPIRSVIHSFKYREQIACLKSFSCLFEEKLKNKIEIGEDDLIIPVPLHKKRLKERGFNQAFLLAKSFFPERKRQIDLNSLKRSRETVPQTGLNRKERQKNIRNAFQVMKPEKIKGRKVILVDDVVTTATTLNECARQLKKAGAEFISVVTLARAVD